MFKINNPHDENPGGDPAFMDTVVTERINSGDLQAIGGLFLKAAENARCDNPEVEEFPGEGVSYLKSVAHEVAMQILSQTKRQDATEDYDKTVTFAVPIFIVSLLADVLNGAISEGQPADQLAAAWRPFAEAAIVALGDTEGLEQQEDFEDSWDADSE